MIKRKMRNTVENKTKGRILRCYSHTQISRFHSKPDSWGLFLLHHSYWPRHGAHPSFCQRIPCWGFPTSCQWLWKSSPGLPTKVLLAIPHRSCSSLSCSYSFSGWTPFSKWCTFFGVHPMMEQITFIGQLPVGHVLWHLFYCSSYFSKNCGALIGIL